MTQEKEDHDRVSLLLPGKQMDLASSVASVSKNPIILVLTGGGPLDVTFAESNPWISSILWIGYPGEAGGKAPAEVVFGDFNPGGRLPMTWYPESFTRAPMSDMNMRADPSRGYPGRTYRFYNRDRIYGFEHSTRASLTSSSLPPRSCAYYGPSENCPTGTGSLRRLKALTMYRQMRSNTASH
ncbi:hypothetical protein CRG98_018167 [Punica granatum]|uniref:Glycoside hydrolase family 3 C-terminal domain-containing protein n=1 Tax=Punica granatum TaxID=22663 RepID=A0A2I0JYR2_PUNGR|nr:hypothetical protein CRG98_018167 [Punica granatum]